MNSFALLYLFYSAKLGSQASIYFIWLEDSSSGKIAFIAAAVAVLAIFPFFHVLVHIFSAKPLSSSTFIGYLCFSFLLTILGYEPTRDGAQRVLPFALVTAVDLLDLLIFLFQKRIGHWHDVLTWDPERGQDDDDASLTFVDRGIEQVEHRDFSARTESEIRRIQVLQDMGWNIDAINNPQTVPSSLNRMDATRLNPRSVVDQSNVTAGGRGFGHTPDGDETNGRFAGADAVVQGPSNIGWGQRMVQSVSEGEVREESRAGRNLGQQVRQNGLYIDLGVVAGNDADSGFETHHPSPLVETPVPVYDTIHPTMRPTFGGTSQPVSPEDYQTPRQAPSPTGISMQELNRF